MLFFLAQFISLYVSVSELWLYIFLPESVELPTLPLFSTTSSDLLISLNALNYMLWEIFVRFGRFFRRWFSFALDMCYVQSQIQHNMQHKDILAHPFVCSCIAHMVHSLIHRFFDSLEFCGKIWTPFVKWVLFWLIRVKRIAEPFQWNPHKKRDRERNTHQLFLNTFELPAKLFMAMPKKA